MIDRINLVLKAKNITARQFAEEIGIQPSGMSHIMSGRNKPSLEFVAKVIRRYPEIDANWLLMGRGEMYTSAPQTLQSAPLPSSPSEPMLFPIDEPVPLEESPLVDDTESVDLFESQPVPPDEPSAEPVAAPEVAVDRVEPEVDGRSDGVRLERIIFVYSDNTFRELLPSAARR